MLRKENGEEMILDRNATTDLRPGDIIFLLPDKYQLHFIRNATVTPTSQAATTVTLYNCYSVSGLHFCRRKLKPTVTLQILKFWK